MWSIPFKNLSCFKCLPRNAVSAIGWILTNSPGSLYSTPQLYSITTRVLGQDPSSCHDNNDSANKGRAIRFPGGGGRKFSDKNSPSPWGWTEGEKNPFLRGGRKSLIQFGNRHVRGRYMHAFVLPYNHFFFINNLKLLRGVQGSTPTDFPLNWFSTYDLRYFWIFLYVYKITCMGTFAENLKLGKCVLPHAFSLDHFFLLIFRKKKPPREGDERT